ncbi:hypothetical protein [Sedimenticola hydrogenitrophicus]|uniref:hypothetical protein n=1 Tax=Sedimenticola hydrogenitrophicus TaxID=2967975 RepID=UPI0023AFDE96|nr:hypothetical protein [Sedimenticola hydrogenitrophicus]
MERQKCVTAARLQPGDPLWRRVPTSDPAGQNLNDFMLLIPGLKRWAQHRRERLLEELRGVFEHHADRVVFADLNLKLNLLWISHRQGKGVSLALFEAIRERVPEALLVASQAEVQQGLQQQARRRAARRLLGRDGS